MALAGIEKHRRPAAWLQPDFARRHRASLAGYESRLKFFGPLPSFQENLNALEVLRRQLACSALTSQPLFEKSYPYLDRDLLEFIYAIPREQLVRPHQRRSLMRRALAGIVPDELLNRKRKAFVVRGPIAAVSKQWPSLVEMTKYMVTGSLGIVNQYVFVRTLQKMRQGEEVPIVPIMRTLGIEFWLRNLLDSNLLQLPGRAHENRRLQGCGESVVW
jgi:asparagine synthase (glutamine-hydrolysing)